MASAFAIPAESQPPVADGRDEVFRWREEQFRELGVGSSQAKMLAASNADLGQARYLRASGCPPEIAVQILL
jgi:hypothetical protein